MYEICALPQEAWLPSFDAARAAVWQPACVSTEAGNAGCAVQQNGLPASDKRRRVTRSSLQAMVERETM